MTASAAEQLDLPSQLARRDQRPGGGGGGPNVFMVITPERTLFVGCESLETYSEWVRALRSLIANEQQRLVAVVRTQLLASAPPSSPPFKPVTSPPPPPSRHAEPHPPRESASHAASFPSHAAAHFSGPDGARSVLDAVPEAPEVDALADADGVNATPPAAVNPRGVELSPSPSSEVASPPAQRGAAAAPETPASATAPISFSPASLTSPAPPAASAGLAGAAHQNWEIQLDDVELEERIGKGAYGEVYRGRLWGTDVAVKRLLSATLTPEVLENLKEEVSILSQLRHPNVVLYLGACTAPPDVCIVTEWAEHGSLHEQLYDRTVPMSAVNRLGLALQTAQGMSYLHAPRHMIIHRDLKSHNLLLTRDYTVKVADFGLTVRRGAHPPHQADGADGPGRRPSVSAAVSSSADSSPHTGLTVTEPEGSTVTGRAPRLSGTALGKGDKGRRVSDAEGGLLAHLTRAANEGGAGGPSAEAGEFYGIQGTPQWMVSLWVVALSRLLFLLSLVPICHARCRLLKSSRAKSTTAASTSTPSASYSAS